MITIEQIRKEAHELIDRVVKEIVKDRDPIYENVQFGQQPWNLNYRNRKHIFAYNTTNASVTLTSTDNMIIVLAANSWSNLGFQESTRLTVATGNPLIIMKMTDEAIP